MNRFTNVIVAVSPSQFGGETKDQDRATFDRRTQTACVCDGITSSPHAGQAAQIIAKAASLIVDDPDVHLKMAADFLFDCRNIALASPVKVNTSVPVSIRPLVQEAAKASLKTSYQTTIVAVRCQMEQSHLTATMVSCGDSGIFAYSPSGQLLFTNLAEKRQAATNPTKSSCKTLCFCPGRELLVESQGALVHYPVIAQGLKVQTPDKWLLCRAIRLLEEPAWSLTTQSSEVLELCINELLAVPKYLITPVKASRHRKLGRLNYSRFARKICEPISDYSDLTFNLQGHITAALPDAYNANQCYVFNERFPIDTDFLLCSDGFYRAFSTPTEMWQWLRDHQDALTLRRHKKKLLQDLHRRLDQVCGDDDISFVWMRPPHRKEGF